MSSKLSNRVGLVVAARDEQQAACRESGRTARPRRERPAPRAPGPAAPRCPASGSTCSSASRLASAGGRRPAAGAGDGRGAHRALLARSAGTAPTPSGCGRAAQPRSPRGARQSSRLGAVRPSAMEVGRAGRGKVRTQRRPVPRQGSSPRPARRSPTTTPGTWRVWKFAARWPGRSALPRGGWAVDGASAGCPATRRSRPPAQPEHDPQAEQQGEHGAVPERPADGRRLH